MREITCHALFHSLTSQAYWYLRYDLLIELNQADTISLPTLSSVHSVDILGLCLVNQKVTVACPLCNALVMNFYRATLRSARYCYDKSSVRPSVCPSVTLRYRDHIGWNSSKIISPLVSLGCSLFADPSITGVHQGEHPEILTGIGERYRKSGFRRQNSNISETRQDRTEVGYYWGPTGSHIRAFDWYKNQRTPMTLSEIQEYRKCRKIDTMCPWRSSIVIK